MSDPLAEIRHLFERYQEALQARDLATLAEIHWQDDRLTHIGWSGRVDRGWSAYEKTLAAELGGLTRLDFRLVDLRPELFGGRFAVVNARWESDSGATSGGPSSSAGWVTFVLTVMGGSWKIVADQFAAA